VFKLKWWNPDVHITPLVFNNIMRRRIHICSGSRAVIAALTKITTKSALVWESMQGLEKLSGSVKVT
jgi:hypothetical protein